MRRVTRRWVGCAPHQVHVVQHHTDSRHRPAQPSAAYGHHLEDVQRLYCLSTNEEEEVEFLVAGMLVASVSIRQGCVELCIERDGPTVCVARVLSPAPPIPPIPNPCPSTRTNTAASIVVPYTHCEKKATTMAMACLELLRPLRACPSLTGALILFAWERVPRHPC